jgi:uncharacterized protein YggE
MKELFKENKVFVFKVLVIFVCGLILVNSFDKDHGYKGVEANQSTITVSGKGEVNAVPDIATITFSITKDAKTVKEAQALVSEVQNKVIASLKENKIEEKDYKALNSSFYPKYEYQNTSSRYAPEIAIYPPVGKSVIVGYTATLSMQVKVRDTDNAGKVITDLGTLGVTDLSGPNFEIDNEDSLKAEARKKAIEEAKNKAKVLSRDLGVRLGRITSFSETPSYGTPIYYAKAESLDASAGANLALPKGENTITSEVSITYKIK